MAPAKNLVVVVDNEVNTKAVVGSLLGVVLLAAVIALIVIVIFYKRKRNGGMKR